MRSSQRLGALVQANSRRLLLAASLALVALSAAIRSARLDSDLAGWLQRSGRLEAELQAVAAATGEGAATTGSLLLLQTARQPRANLLTVDALMVHLEAMAIANHVTVDLYEVAWSLKDICFAPSPPDFEGAHVDLLLDNLLPCAIKTPLDCFWEGAKLLGPDQPASLGALGPALRWTQLNPELLVEGQLRLNPRAAFPYAQLLDWMRRVGIASGYQHKPCLDPTDPNCPPSAPNSNSSRPPDVGAQLTGGCRGLAAKQMHWREEELVGGATHNKSGQLVRAAALQTTIQLMGEQDMYDYWRKTSKVQDVHNWSADKAKSVLEAWQRRFKEELAHFLQTSASSSPYKIHAMTPQSMLEPIDPSTLLDLSNLELCFILMTLFTIVAFPSFGKSSYDVTFKGFKVTLLAASAASFVGLTFIASLGLSSFLNLPFNMATTQILPPLALYYGFKQAIMIANIYSRKFKTTPKDLLTTECLTELLPVVTIESTTCIIPLTLVTLLPVAATRVFALQAITHILLSALIAIILMPAMFTTFILHLSVPTQPTSSTNQSLSGERPQSRTGSIGNISIGKRKCIRPDRDATPETDIEEQIFSRIQDDLKNIKAESKRQHPTDINFSAHYSSDGLSTSFTVTRATEEAKAHDEPHRDNKLNTCNLVQAKSNIDRNSHIQSNFLPDLLDGVFGKTDLPVAPNEDKPADSECKARDQCDLEAAEAPEAWKKSYDIFNVYSNCLTNVRPIQATVFLIKLFAFIAIFVQIFRVRYGLEVRDIVIHGTDEYEAFSIRDRYFPIYNAFIITKGNFDYPSNQKLLHEYYRLIEQVEGVVKDDPASKPKFWLLNFRDWLLELQTKFDSDRNQSLISGEGWTQDASEAAKLGYKLLAQTGRVDSPVDKRQVETNRLVDSNGIINSKAFYYYLTAWVTNDAFTYSTSEANFRPEPKSWNSNPDDLRIERARPLNYAQIPFLLKLPSSHDNLKTIQEIRSISQAFEQLNLPNFPTGVPLLFWDQFIYIDLLFFTAIAISSILIYITTGLLTSDFKIAAIITISVATTTLELHGLVGYLSIPFNNILAVLLLGTIGTSTVQTIHLTTCFETKEGNLRERTRECLNARLRTVITSLMLFFVCALVFKNSKIDFMIKYSCLLICLGILNIFNALFMVPIVLSIFGPEYRPPQSMERKSPERGVVKQRSKCISHKKKRSYPRVQSEISLSTISEEPQSEQHISELKLDISIRC